jgi:hypothetical protein
MTAGNLERAATPVLVLLGLDGSGKPHASRFPIEYETVALKAAGMMNLHALNIADPELINAATDLPEGKIFATGRGLVPFVRRELYDRFAPLLGTAAEQETPKPEQHAPAVSSAPASGALRGDAPEPWASLKTGSVVLATDAAEGGWYEAVVLAVSDDEQLLTVAWRDFPREAKQTIHRTRVGVLLNT